MRAKELWYFESGNTNGVSLSPDDSTLYLSDTGASEVKPSRRNLQGQRDLWTFDIPTSSKTGQKLPVLTNRRLLARAISYFYDGIRVSRNGWIFGAGGEVVDVLDPESGMVLGSIRVGGGGNDPVNIVLGEHEMWIVGKGGVWEVSGIRERLSKGW